ncbi:MAG TPA: class I SAM-dependent methyltransferase [Stellaceae bacterium]|jgi:hypothetical protein|nr:class I SAM-dependent methyltransferase [Stellaceae bacterium]
MELVNQTLLVRDTCRILDIGGEPEYWANLIDMLGPCCWHITIVNLQTFVVEDNRFASIIGDARNLDQFSDMSFDIVHSNSVIEHVGRWQDMHAMAREVRRLAPAYFVQTPYFWFPIEPHCMTPLFHWLPESVRVSMLMRRSRGHWSKAIDIDEAMRKVQSAVLLDFQMLSSLFPDGRIASEYVCGLTKSLIAIRTAA